MIKYEAMDTSDRLRATLQTRTTRTTEWI